MQENVAKIVTPSLFFPILGQFKARAVVDVIYTFIRHSLGAVPL